MAKRMILEISILDYWHCGSGRSNGYSLDFVAERDSLGLPFVPGRVLKGILRDALARYEAYGHTPQGTTLALFGASGMDAPAPGGLRIADARLPEALRNWLQADGSAAYRQGLSRELFSSAVDETTGITSERRPRGIETIVPLTLESELQPITGLPLPVGWSDILIAALPLVGAVGAYRTRGLGRCEMRIFQEGAHGTA